MPKKYKSTATPEGRERRLRAFRHNALRGHTHMMRQQLLSIMASPTATAYAKALANALLPRVCDLTRALEQRNDQENDND